MFKAPVSLLLWLGLWLGSPAGAAWRGFGGGDKAATDFAGQTLHILTWEDYIAPELAAAFTRETGAELRWSYFDDDHHRDTRLKEQGALGTDLVLVNEKNIRRYRKRGWLAPLSAEEAPNLKHIAGRWFDRFPDARGIAAPYFRGVTGIL